MAIEDILKEMGAITETPVTGERERNLETIDYEYVVSFRDGLKPNAIVYGKDQQGKIYGLDTAIGVILTVGLVPLNGQEDCITLKPLLRFGAPTSSVPFAMKKDYTAENFEEEMKRECLEKRINLIRVKNLHHMETVVGRYAQQYGQQFEELGRQIAERFYQFVVKEHLEYLGSFNLHSEEQASEE